MIKSYQEWNTDKKYLDNLRTFLEFNVRTLWKNMTGQGMGKESKAGYERLGAMIGYAPSGWNTFAKDSSQQGLEFMNMVQANPANAMNMVKNGAKLQGSPLQLAYRTVDELKQKYGHGPLDKKDLMVLVNILMNTYKDGTVDFGDLRHLWNMVTGIEKSPPDAATEQNKKNALNDDIFSPLHLLNKFFSIGNGIFSAPSNLSKLRIDTSEIIRQYYPELYKTMFKDKFGRDPDSDKPKPPPGDSIDPKDLDNFNIALGELMAALAKTPPVPKEIADIVKRLGPLSQKLKDTIDPSKKPPPTPPVPPPTPPVPPPTP